MRGNSRKKKKTGKQAGSNSKSLVDCLLSKKKSGKESRAQRRFWSENAAEKTAREMPRRGIGRDAEENGREPRPKWNCDWSHIVLNSRLLRMKKKKGKRAIWWKTRKEEKEKTKWKNYMRRWERRGRYIVLLYLKNIKESSLSRRWRRRKTSVENRWLLTGPRSSALRGAKWDQQLITGSIITIGPKEKKNPRNRPGENDTEIEGNLFSRFGWRLTAHLIIFLCTVTHWTASTTASFASCVLRVHRPSNTWVPRHSSGACISVPNI